jgi:hypothetical protein
MELYCKISSEIHYIYRGRSQNANFVQLEGRTRMLFSRKNTCETSSFFSFLQHPPKDWEEFFFSAKRQSA